MRYAVLRRILFSFAAAALIPACDVGGGNVELTVFESNGGDASGPGSQGGAGGSFTVISASQIEIGVEPPPQAPALPTPPKFGTTITSADLSGNSYILSSGNLIISGTVTTPPGQAIFDFTAAQGDIVVSGSVIAGIVGPGNNTSNVTLAASKGNVYILGEIRTTSPNASGTPDSGTVNLFGNAIYVTGSITTAGVSISTGANGGGVFIENNSSSPTIGSDVVLSGAKIDTSGSGGTTSAGMGGGLTVFAANEIRVHNSVISTNAGSITAGSAGSTAPSPGNVSITSPNGVFVSGSTFNMRGGNCTTTGGAATASAGGNLSFPTSSGVSVTGPVYFYGTQNASGGVAKGVTASTSGNGGQFTLGGAISPQSVFMGSLSHSMVGGKGGSAGGVGGILFVQNKGLGEIVFNGSVDTSGGSATSATGIPGSASNIEIQSAASSGDIFVSGRLTAKGGDGANPTIGQGPTNGGDLNIQTPSVFSSIHLDATIDLSGGSSTAATSVNVSGGGGGQINIGTTNTGVFTLNGTTGGITLSGTYVANGGSSTGTAQAGNSGVMTVIGYYQPITFGAHYTALGGTARGTGGVGGDANWVHLNSGDQESGTKTTHGDDIVILAGAAIDLSGGAGTTGGGGGTVTLIGRNNSPGDGTSGRILNNGSIQCTGGASNGHGGHVTFTGTGAAGTGVPVVGPGTVNVSQNGTGAAGTITLN